MKVVALVGESGSGKSYKAISVAKDLGIEYIIDDGLLIKGTKIIGGKSAKRERSTVSAVKRAIFMDDKHKKQVRDAIDVIRPKGILILGTSDKMVKKIALNLGLPEISKTIYIRDISTEDEINIAKGQRTKEGKHVIPVPTFEIKKDFSGYFMDTLKIFTKRGNGIRERIYEKSVVRPTFSYLGNYTISRKVIIDLVKYGAKKTSDISKVYNIYVDNLENGVLITADTEIIYEKPIREVIKKLQENIIREVEMMTSLNILAVNIKVMKLKKKELKEKNKE
ncbi:hypothetical protein [Dethiothermospora halolimnae]|uniref:hypothetical protein n=1 Tax=Dethiothermospora halolimnae TaxID=3114390 RepID=UPI003CCBADFA